MRFSFKLVTHSARKVATHVPIIMSFHPFRLRNFTASHFRFFAFLHSMGLHWLFGSFLRFPCFCLRRMSDFCPHLCHFQAICCLLDSICFHPFFLLKNTNMFSVALHAKLLYKLLSRPNSMTSFCFFTSAPCCFCSFPQKYGLISNFIKACPHSFSISRIFSLTQIRKREYPKILSQQRETRFELATLALARRCSTTEPLAHNAVYGT